MVQETKVITLPLPLRIGRVNCYLAKTEGGYILIDTGSSNQRAILEKELEAAGCVPGNLKLIVITHGDFDHTGNAAYLRAKYGAKIAMHEGDQGMAEHGDMFWNRKSGNALIRKLAPILVGFPKSGRFCPDVCLEEGDHLGEYGFDARVVSIPGHSLGSIGILAADGSLFCGDLFENRNQPALSSIMDDPVTAWASFEKLRGMPVETIYPGHGDPFPITQLG